MSASLNQNRTKPRRRGRTGSKHHLITDATGIPLASLTGGNRNDVTERAHVAQLVADRRDVHWGRLIFGAKESVYKAWFPLTHRWLDFEEGEIRIDPAADTFRAQLVVPGPEMNGTRLPGFGGRWLVRAGLIVTTIAVPRLLPATPPAAPRAAGTQEARRGQIVNAAVETIAARGFAKASLAQIAERAGISKGVISFHFTGTDEPIELVVEQLDRLAAFMAPRLQKQDERERAGGWLRACIQSVAEYMADHRTQLTALGEIFSNFRQRDGAPRHGVVISEPIYATLEQVFREGQKRGDFRPFDARMMAVSLQSGIDAMFAYWNAYPEHAWPHTPANSPTSSSMLPAPSVRPHRNTGRAATDNFAAAEYSRRDDWRDHR